MCVCVYDPLKEHVVANSALYVATVNGRDALKWIFWAETNFGCACVTPPTRVRTNSPSGSRTRDSGAGGGRSNKERQRLQPLASVTRAPLLEVRGARFTHSPYWLVYIRYTHPPKPHSRPGHGTNVTPPRRVRTNSPSGSRTRDSGAGGRRSNKERQRLQPLASVARAPLFEVRGARFTHSPYWLVYIRYTWSKTKTENAL